MRYRRRLRRLLIEAAPPLPSVASDSDALPSPLLLRPDVLQVKRYEYVFVCCLSVVEYHPFLVIHVFTRLRLQDQLGQLKAIKPEQHAGLQPPPQRQTESHQQPSVQHNVQLQFEGPMPSPKSSALSSKSQIKRRHRHYHQRQHEFNQPVSSTPRSPALTHRQRIIDSLLALAMSSVKQQPSSSISTLVQGGPGGFRSARRQQVSADTSVCLNELNHSTSAAFQRLGYQRSPFIVRVFAVCRQSH